MKDGVLEEGERLLKLSLDFNAFDFLKKYKNFNFDTFKDIIDLKIAVISLTAFFELFIKWAISLESKEDIWVRSKSDSKRSFNIEDYETGKFQSESLFSCLKIAVDKKWLTETDKKLILDVEEIRNSIIHFEVTGNTRFFDGYSLLLTKSIFDNSNTIISSLIKKHFSNFSNHLKIEYKDLIDFYVR